MTTPKPRIRFRLRPKETGLRRIGAGPRGWDLMYGDLRIGGVSPLGGGWRGPVTGWYWVASEASVGVPWCNTCRAPYATPEEAKAACMAYVRECLNKIDKEGP